MKILIAILALSLTGCYATVQPRVGVDVAVGPAYARPVYVAPQPVYVYPGPYYGYGHYHGRRW